ncbi:hypothetical protein KFE25_009520 [Diacronema lutheri]|mgnify:CR=1 FL=1|uniref:Uncharacterized protein n=1 Tax=Diacronema lutheri TaxID=2081491 RepID=A0A8J6CFV4_DIALT|nr:hypothetical protein KFE25_009520 [Diacronema lutheri]
MHKQLTVAAARELQLGADERLVPGDAIFYVPAACANVDAAVLDGLTLLSVGVVVACGPHEVVVHEMLRPNPLEWGPTAWAPNPNTLFSTGVHVVVPRSAVKARALIEGSNLLQAGQLHAADAGGGDRATGAQQLADVREEISGADTENNFASPGDKDKARPFVISGAMVAAADSGGAACALSSASSARDRRHPPAEQVAQFAGTSPVLWSSLEALRTRAAEVERRVGAVSDRLGITAKTMLNALKEVEGAAGVRIEAAKRATEERFGERDAFVLLELNKLSMAVDKLEKAMGAREKADAATKAASAASEERLVRVERNVASLQAAQAQINAKAAAQLAELSSRTCALDAALALVNAQAESNSDNIAALSEHLAKRLTQFGRAQSELREDFDALQLGGGGLAASGGGAKKRGATGQLVARTAGTMVLAPASEPEAHGSLAPSALAKAGACGPTLHKLAKTPPSWSKAKPSSASPAAVHDHSPFAGHRGDRQTMSTPSGVGGSSGASRPISEL